ncbi:hypothetical protein ACI65C_009716 [Semiaphis heraclei]
MPEVVDTLNQPSESAHLLSISTLKHDAESLIVVDSQDKATTVFSHEAKSIAVTPVDSQKKSTTIFSHDLISTPLTSYEPVRLFSDPPFINTLTNGLDKGGKKYKYDENNRYKCFLTSIDIGLNDELQKEKTLKKMKRGVFGYFNYHLDTFHIYNGVKS